jgi:ferredoxin
MPEDPQDLVRELLVRELETVNVYAEMAESARTPGVRTLIAEITAQEKHHIGEAMDLLARFDAGQAAALAARGIGAARSAPETAAPQPADSAASSTTHVTYEPSGREVAASGHESLLAEGLDAGVDITHVCGGKGECGTCRVEVLAGAEALSGVTEPERKLLDGLLDQGWRLACQTRPLGPVRVRVPLAKAKKEG